MRRCQNCGGEASDGAGYCPECGAALGPAETADPGGHGEGPPGGGQHTQGGRPRQGPAGNGPQGQPPGGNPGPPPRQQGPPSEDGGLSRRQLLAAGVGVVALAGAGGGWYFFLREAGDPLAVLERSWTAWENGNAEAYRQLYHSESPERETQYWNDDQYWADFGPSDGVDWTIEERELVNEAETRATAREVYTWRQPDQPTLRITDLIELQTENGEWKIWQLENQNTGEIGGGGS